MKGISYYKHAVWQYYSIIISTDEKLKKFPLDDCSITMAKILHYHGIIASLSQAKATENTKKI